MVFFIEPCTIPENVACHIYLTSKAGEWRWLASRPVGWRYYQLIRPLLAG